MGSCYSRKASKSQSSSSFAVWDQRHMATSKNEEVSSRTRPTPYSRNIPQPNSPISKTFIPKPAETFSMDGKYQGRSSSIPRPTGPKNQPTVTSSEDIDTNSNNSTSFQESHHLVNNNIKHSVTSPSSKMKPIPAPKIQTSSSKIPSKLTAHLVLQRSHQVAPISQKNSIISNDSDKREGGDSDKKAKKSSSHNNTHSPPDGDEWDSGVGSLVERPNKDAEDAETLKDAEESLEGSPTVSKASNTMVHKHILKFENISMPTDDFSKKKNTKSLKQNSFHNPSTYRGVFNYSESFKKTFSDYESSPPPLYITYGSYKHFLSYKKREQKEIKSDKPRNLPANLNDIGIASKEHSKTKSSQLQQSENGDNSTVANLSPVTELENPQFLIDDEISDQPGLISFQQRELDQRVAKHTQHNTLEESVNELRALKVASACPQPIEAGNISSCSDGPILESGNNSKARAVKSRPLSLGCETVRLRSTSMPFRPPRQMSFSEQDDGCVRIDASSYRLLCQDLNSVKTMLHRLKGIIYDAETLNPFDQVAGSKNAFYKSMAHNDLPVGCPLPSPHLEEHKSDLGFVQQENADLRRQLVLLQQQLEDRDHTIKLLQQQMLKYENIPGEDQLGERCNSATQTERLGFSYSPSLTEELLPPSTSTLVSFRIRQL